MEERNSKISELTYELMQALSKEIVSPLYYTEIQEDGSVAYLETKFGEKINKTIDKTLTKYL